jgi:hypothetical protein
MVKVDLKKYIGKTKSLEQDIVRTLLIIFHFGNELPEDEQDDLKLVLRSEYYIQKLDFLLRNPDYLCLELLSEVRDGVIVESQAEKVKIIIKDIYSKDEPILRRIPMQRFFYGAYERLDEVESFLTSVGFLKVRPQGNLDRIHVKNYYLTTQGFEYITKELLLKCTGVDWYNNRCLIICEFLGHISASELKSRQYGYESYSQARWGSDITSVTNLVKEKYQEIFEESLEHV